MLGSESHSQREVAGSSIEGTILAERYPHLNKQLRSYTHNLSEIHEKRGERGFLKQPDLESIFNYFSLVILERNDRAEEINSEEMTSALQIIDSLFSYHIYRVGCIDGRSLDILKFAFPAKFGGSRRTPGGDIPEIVQAQDSSQFILLPGSPFALEIDQKFESNNTLVETIDTHLHCKKVKVDSEDIGENLPDEAHLKSVKRMKAKGDAMKSYAEKYHPGKIMRIIQFASNPENGYGYMGLEQDHVLKYAEEKGGYTIPVLKTLSQREEIISTENITQEPKIRTIFKEALKSITLEKNGEIFFTFDNFDWKTQYAKSALLFWKAMAQMKNEILPIIQQKVLSLYPHLSSDDPNSKQELYERSMLLFANAFSGFVLNKDMYQYGEHEEAVIIISPGGYSPFTTASFAVYSNDGENLLPNTLFASGIIRDNRAKGRIHDPTNTYLDEKNYKKAYVPVLLQEIIRNGLSETQWEQIRLADWSDLKNGDWRKMTKDDFTKYLIKKLPGIAASLVEGINNLREKMIILYDQKKSGSEQIVNGNIVVLPTISNSNRGIEAIIPFVLSGY